MKSFRRATLTADVRKGNPLRLARCGYRASIGPSGRPPKMWTWRCGTSWPGVHARRWRAADSPARPARSSRAILPTARTKAGDLLVRALSRKVVPGDVGALGNHQDVRRRERVDVVEGERMLVLVDLLRRDLAAQDPREDVVVVIGLRGVDRHRMTPLDRARPPATTKSDERRDPRKPDSVRRDRAGRAARGRRPRAGRGRAVRRAARRPSFLHHLQDPDARAFRSPSICSSASRTR